MAVAEKKYNISSHEDAVRKGSAKWWSQRGLESVEDFYKNPKGKRASRTGDSVEYTLYKLGFYVQHSLHSLSKKDWSSFRNLVTAYGILYDKAYPRGTESHSPTSLSKLFGGTAPQLAQMIQVHVQAVPSVAQHTTVVDVDTVDSVDTVDNAVDSVEQSKDYPHLREK